MKSDNDDALDKLVADLSHDQKIATPAPPSRIVTQPESYRQARIIKRIPKKTVPLAIPAFDPKEEPLFSEKHPQAFKASRMVLPRIGPLILTIWLCIAVVSNLVRGDITFAYRWFHDNQFLQSFLHVITSKAALQSWFSQYGVLMVLMVTTIVMVTIVLHKFLWRFFFKDYIRFTEGVETYEGRTFWTEGAGFWFNLWDSKYEKRLNKKTVLEYADQCAKVAKKGGLSRAAVQRIREAAMTRASEELKVRPVYHPEKRQTTVYLKARRWPPIPNPMNPGRSLWKNKLTAGSDERLERRGPYELIVHEGKYRRITGIRIFATHNDPYKSAEIPTLQASSIFKNRTKQLISDTNELSKANVEVRLDKLRSGTVLVDPEIREMTLHEREKKAGT